MFTMFTRDQIDTEIAATRTLRKGQSRMVFGVEVTCYKRGWFQISIGNGLTHNGLKAKNVVMLIVNMPSLREKSA